MGIAVAATKPGYYGNRRRQPGERFTIENEKAFSKIWMERLTDRESREILEEEGEIREQRKARGRKERPSDDTSVI